jgi:Family of unknown function (DUF5760)
MYSEKENNVAIEPKKLFVENIQKWVLLDKQLKLIHEKTKEIRENKNKLTNDICDYIQNKNMTNTKIEISDGELKMYEKKDYSPLTFTYIEESLAKILTDKSQVDYIIDFLKKNREIKSSIDIRRTYHK